MAANPRPAFVDPFETSAKPEFVDPFDAPPAPAAPPISALPKPANPTWGDIGKEVATGTANAVATAPGKIIEYGGRKLGLPQAAEFGGELQKRGQGVEDYWRGQMTPAGQNPQGIVNKVGMSIAGSAPGMMAMAGPVEAGAAGMKALQVGKGVSAGLEAAGVSAPRAATIGEYANTALPAGAVEGVLSGGQNAAQTEQEAYAKLVSDGVPEPQARAQARQAGDEVLVRTALSTGGIGAATGGGVLGRLARHEDTGILKGIYKGAKEEGFQELAQSGPEQLIQNLAAQNHYDPERPTWEGVPEAVLIGGLAGGVMGGAGGGLSGLAAKGPLAKAAAAAAQSPAPLPTAPGAVNLPNPAGAESAPAPGVTNTATAEGQNTADYTSAFNGGTNAQNPSDPGVAVPTLQAPRPIQTPEGALPAGVVSGGNSPQAQAPEAPPMAQADVQGAGIPPTARGRTPVAQGGGVGAKQAKAIQRNAWKAKEPAEAAADSLQIEDGRSYVAEQHPGGHKDAGKWGVFAYPNSRLAEKTEKLLAQSNPREDTIRRAALSHGLPDANARNDDPQRLLGEIALRHKMRLQQSSPINPSQETPNATPTRTDQSPATGNRQPEGGGGAADEARGRIREQQPARTEASAGDRGAPGIPPDAAGNDRASNGAADGAGRGRIPAIGGHVPGAELVGGTENPHVTARGVGITPLPAAANQTIPPAEKANAAKMLVDFDAGAHLVQWTTASRATAKALSYGDVGGDPRAFENWLKSQRDTIQPNESDNVSTHPKIPMARGADAHSHKSSPEATTYRDEPWTGGDSSAIASGERSGRGSGSVDTAIDTGAQDKVRAAATPDAAPLPAAPPTRQAEAAAGYGRQAAAVDQGSKKPGAAGVAATQDKQARLYTGEGGKLPFVVDEEQHQREWMAEPEGSGNAIKQAFRAEAIKHFDAQGRFIGPHKFRVTTGKGVYLFNQAQEALAFAEQHGLPKGKKRKMIGVAPLANAAKPVAAQDVGREEARPAYEATKPSGWEAPAHQDRPDAGKIVGNRTVKPPLSPREAIDRATGVDRPAGTGREGLREVGPWEAPQAEDTRTPGRSRVWEKPGAADTKTPGQSRVWQAPAAEDRKTPGQSKVWETPAIGRETSSALPDKPAQNAAKENQEVPEDYRGHRLYQGGGNAEKWLARPREGKNDLGELLGAFNSKADAKAAVDKAVGQPQSGQGGVPTQSVGTIAKPPVEPGQVASPRPPEAVRGKERMGKAVKPATTLDAVSDDPEMAKLQAELYDALKEVGEAFINLPPSVMKAVQMDNAKMLPALAKTMDIAFRMGHHQFKQNAKFVLAQIRKLFGDEAADSLTLRQVKAAYNFMAEGKDQADSETTVAAVKSMDDLLREEKEEANHTPEAEAKPEAYAEEMKRRADEQYAGWKGREKTEAEPAPEEKQEPKPVEGFKKGDRVVIGNHYMEAMNGRHGVVTDAQSYTTRTSVIDFSSGLSPKNTREETSTDYHVKTDQGLEVIVDEKLLTAETGEAPAVDVPDVEIDGKHYVPYLAWSHIKSREKQADDSAQAGLRAKKPDKKQSLAESADRYRKEAAAGRKAFDAWARKHPDAAALASDGQWVDESAPKTEKQAEAPSALVDGRLSGPFNSSTAKGTPTFVVGMKERVSTDEFAKLRAQASKHGGMWWGKGKTPGFSFKTREQALAFMRGEGPVKAAETLADNEVRPEDSPYVYRLNLDGSWSFQVRTAGQAGGDKWNSVSPAPSLMAELDAGLKGKTQAASVAKVEEAKTVGTLEDGKLIGHKKELWVDAPQPDPDNPGAPLDTRYFVRGMDGNEKRLHGRFELSPEGKPIKVVIFLNHMKDDVNAAIKEYLGQVAPQSGQGGVTTPERGNEINSGDRVEYDLPLGGPKETGSVVRVWRDSQGNENVELDNGHKIDVKAAGERLRKVAPQSGQGGVPTQSVGTITQLPWAGAQPQDSDKWYGTKLVLTPKENQGQRSGKAVLEEVKNGGDVLEVRWEGDSFQSRVNAKHTYNVEITELVESKNNANPPRPEVTANVPASPTSVPAGNVAGTGGRREPPSLGGRKGGGAGGSVRVGAGQNIEQIRQTGPEPHGTDAGANLGTVRSVDKPVERVATAAQAGADYRIGRGDLTRAGSWLETAKRNVAIVELVNQIEQEGRAATPEEQAQLVKFTGWGAGEIRNNLFPTHAGTGTGYKPHYVTDKNWRELAERIKEVFTKKDWETVLKSTQYAHYTSEPVIRAIWRGVERLGFAGGSVLEPGAGVGLFAGLMPDNVHGSSHYVGVEMDGFSARIAQLLFPQQSINPSGQGDYVKAKLPKGFFDLAIGNPPFASIKIPYNGKKLALHDFFFAKTIDQVRPGGLMVFVTSRYTMDKQDDAARAYLAERADLLGAVRLPQTAFKANAGTEVVTDVLFLRKREAGQASAGVAWQGLAEVEVAEGKTLPVNEYFARHPDMVLGTHSEAGAMYRQGEYTVIPKEGDIEQQFAEAVERLPQNVYSVQSAGASVETTRAASLQKDWNPKHRKEGGVYIADDGRLMRVEEGVGSPLEGMVKLSAKEKEWMTDYVPLRDTLKQAQFDQLTDGDWQASLKALQKQYAAFVKKHGPVLDFTRTEKTEVDEDGNEVTTVRETYTNKRLMNMDVEGTLLSALEQIKEDGTIVKAPVLVDRVLKKPVQPTIENVHDALAVALADTGAFDLDHVAALAGLDKGEAIQALGDLVYEMPSGGHVLADDYLSGDVKSKLEEAEVAAKVKPGLRRNVDALLKVQPEPLGADQITAGLGNTWLPVRYYSQFAQEVVELPGGSVSYNPVTSEFLVDADVGKIKSRDAAAKWGHAARSPLEILDAAMNRRNVRVYHGSGTKDDPRVFDEKDTAEVNELISQLQNEFSNWVWTDADRAEHLLNLYNEKFNRLAPRYFKADFLNPPGLSLKFKLHDHQKRAIWRAIQTGNTYFAHAVGAGKTLEMIIAGMEQKRLGLISKPMYAVPNHMLAQFAREFLEAYPAANIMVADETNFHTDNRRRFIAQAALNNPDAIIVTHSAMNMMEMKPENVRNAFDDVLNDLRETLEDIPDDWENKKTRSKIEAQIERIERGMESKAELAKQKRKKKEADSAVGIALLDKRIADAKQQGKSYIGESIAAMEKQREEWQRLIEKESRDAEREAAKNSAVYFEDLGVDFLFVDEAHNYRKLDYATKMQVKGISPEGSQGALRLFVKTRWLESQRPGRSFVFASGTPVTNTMAELFSIQRFFMEKELRALGLIHFDAWAAQFGRVKAEYERNATGNWETVQRFSKFVNVADMMAQVRQFMDVLTMKELSGLVKLPTLAEGNAGRRTIITTPRPEALDDYLHGELSARLKASREWKPTKDEPNNPDPVVAIITDGRLSALDMRFIDPKLPDDSDSKLNQACDKLIEDYKALAGNEYIDSETGKVEAVKGGTQIVFASVGIGEGVAASRGFSAKEWIKKRLKAGGIPTKEIAFMEDYKKAADKEKLFKDMRQGKVRILIGTPKNMGTGVNVQKRLARHYMLDAPWYPADVEQPDGRILRQGNQNETIAMFGFATDGTYDSTMWGMVARKGAFIEQAFAGDRSLRVMDDMSESGAYAMAAAIASGDARYIQMAELEGQVARLETQYANHDKQQRALKTEIAENENGLKVYRERLKTAKAIAADLGGKHYYSQDYDAVVNGVSMPKVKAGELGEAVRAVYESLWNEAEAEADTKAANSTEMVKDRWGETSGKHFTVERDQVVGSIGEGIQLKAEIDVERWRSTNKRGLTDEIGGYAPSGKVKVIIHGREAWSVPASGSPGQLTGDGIGRAINNALNEANGMPGRVQGHIDETQKTLEGLRRRFGTPFAGAREMVEKTAELARLRAELASEGKQVEGKPVMPAGNITYQLPETWPFQPGRLTRRQEAKMRRSPVQYLDALGGMESARYSARMDAAPKAVDTGNTAAAVRAELGRAGFGAQVEKLERAGLLRIVPFAAGPRGLDARAAAMFEDGQAWLFYDHIAPGEAVGKFLHEVGEHAGLEAMLGAKAYRDLSAQFDRLAAAGDAHALKALRLMPKDTPARWQASEKLAYLIESAANADAAERASMSKGMRALLRDLIAALRAWFYKTPFAAALRAKGINLHLTARDIAALARAAVRYHSGGVTNMVETGEGVRTSGSAAALDADYLDAVRRGDLATAQQMVRDAAEQSGLPVINEDDVTAYKVRRAAPPQNTATAYKLFRVKKTKPGEVFALFVGNKDPLPQGVWLDAEAGPEAGASKTGKRKVKSSLGPLAYRPGWHAGDIPLATHIGAEDGEGNVFARKDDEVWAEVEMADDDPQWARLAKQNGTNADGSFSLAKADVKQMPVNGLYRYKTNPAMTGQWIISGAMKINRILSEGEVNQILRQNDAQAMPWAEKKTKDAPWTATRLNLAKWGLGTDPARNQKKLLDPVTYDDHGEIIPLSQRFDAANSDARYSQQPAAVNDDPLGVFAEIDAAVKPDAAVPKVRRTLARAFDEIHGKARRQALGFLTTKQVVEVGKRLLPRLTDYQRQMDRIAVTRGRVMTGWNNGRSEVERIGADGIAVMHSALPDKEKNRLAHTMHEATIAGVDPSGDYEPSIDLKEAAKQVAVLREQMAQRGGQQRGQGVKTIADLQAEEQALRKQIAFEHQRLKDKDRIQALWDALTPEARRVFELERDFHLYMSHEVERALIDVIQQSEMGGKQRRDSIAKLRKDFESQRVQGPYFPLYRDGDFWVALQGPDKPGQGPVVTLAPHGSGGAVAAKARRGMNKDEIQRVRDLGGRPDKKAKTWIFASEERAERAFGDLLKDPGPQQGEREFHLFRTREEQAEFVEQSKKDGLTVAGSGVKLENLRETMGASSAFVADVENILSDLGDGPEVQAARDQVWQLFLKTLPDMSARKHMIHRKKTAGFGQDALLAFSHKAAHDAYGLARLKHAPEMRRILTELKGDLAAAESPAKLAKDKERLSVLKQFRDEVMGKMSGSEVHQKAFALQMRVQDGDDRARPESERWKQLDDIINDWAKAGDMPQRLAREIHTLEGRVGAADKINAEPDGKEFSSYVISEMQLAHEAIMNPVIAPWAVAANQLGYFYAMALSPAAWIVNTLQTPAKSMPFVAAKFGVKETSAAFAKAYKDAVGDWEAKKKAGEARISVRGVLTGEEAHAYDLAEDSGRIDNTRAHDLMGFAEEGAERSGVARKWAQATAFGFHETERVNREVTFLAAFRLARTRMEFAQAVDYAHHVIDRTHLDYTAANRARFMRGGLARVALQFKSYSQGMMYLWARSAWEAFGKMATPEQKREARRYLALQVGTQMAFAGALGLPVGLLWAAAQAALDGDDDEPEDFEAEFRQAMADLFGVGGGKAVAKGLLNAIGPADIGTRLSEADLLWRDSDRAYEGKDAVSNAVNNLAGPAIGIIGNIADGLRLMGDGHWERGLEKTLPKFIASLLGAGRLANEGALTMKGDALIDDVTPGEVFTKALGFTPERLSDRYAENNATMGVQKRILERRGDLIEQARNAMLQRDAAAQAEAMDSIRAFNRAQPEKAIKRDDVTASARLFARNRARDEHGLVLDRRLQGKLAGRYDFAGD